MLPVSRCLTHTPSRHLSPQGKPALRFSGNFLIEALQSLRKGLQRRLHEGNRFETIADTQPRLLKVKGYTPDPQWVQDITTMLNYFPAHITKMTAQKQGIVVCRYLSDIEEINDQTNAKQLIKNELGIRAYYSPQLHKVIIPSSNQLNPRLLALYKKQHPWRAQFFKTQTVNRLPLVRCLPHELMHALDDTLNKLSYSPAFQQMYDRDIDRLPQADIKQLQRFSMAEKSRWLGLRSPSVDRAKALSETFAEVGSCVLILDHIAPKTKVDAQVLEHAGNIVARFPEISAFYRQKLLVSIEFKSVASLMKGQGVQPVPR